MKAQKAQRTEDGIPRLFVLAYALTVNKCQAVDESNNRPAWTVNPGPAGGAKDGRPAENTVTGMVRAHCYSVATQVPFPDGTTKSRKKHRVDLVFDAVSRKKVGGRAKFNRALVSVRSTRKGSNWCHDTLYREVTRLSITKNAGYADTAILVLTGTGWNEDDLHGVRARGKQEGVLVFNLDEFDAYLNNL